MNKGLAALLALIAGCTFGVGGAISQIIRSHGYEVMHVILSQTIAAVVILGILVAVKVGYTIPRKDTIKLFFVGVVNSVTAVFYFFAIDILSVGTTVAIQFQYVWIVVVFASIADRARPGKWTTISALLIIVGSALGSGLVDELMAGRVVMDPLGLVLALLCALSYALFIFLNGRVAVEHDAVQRTFTQMCGGLLTSVIFFFAMGTGPCDVIGLIPWGVLMSLVMCVVPILFIVIASTNLESGLVSILTSSELPFAVFSGFVLLGETVTPLVVAGVVIILGAIALAQLDNREPKAVEA